MPRDPSFSVCCFGTPKPNLRSTKKQVPASRLVTLKPSSGSNQGPGGLSINHIYTAILQLREKQLRQECRPFKIAQFFLTHNKTQPYMGIEQKNILKAFFFLFFLLDISPLTYQYCTDILLHHTLTRA